MHMRASPSDWGQHALLNARSWNASFPAGLASWGQLKSGTGPSQEAAVAALASQGHLDTLSAAAPPRAGADCPGTARDVTCGSPSSL